jgi:hypothetical protein
MFIAAENIKLNDASDLVAAIYLIDLTILGLQKRTEYLTQGE